MPQDCKIAKGYISGSHRSTVRKDTGVQIAANSMLRIESLPLGVFFNEMPTASELEKGNYFIVNNEPVRVMRKEVVAFGTHSHSKLKIFYQPLNGGGEKTITLQHADKVEIVEIIRKLGQVISKTNSRAQVMDMVSYETLDATAPSEILNELNEGDQVTFVDMKGDVRILEKR